MTPKPNPDGWMDGYTYTQTHTHTQRINRALNQKEIAFENGFKQ